jgi:hypothetical protein
MGPANLSSFLKPVADSIGGPSVGPRSLSAVHNSGGIGVIAAKGPPTFHFTLNQHRSASEVAAHFFPSI